MSPVTLTQQILGACLLIAVGLAAPALSEAKPNAVLSKAAPAPAQGSPSQPEHIILFVVEGIGPESLKGKAMPVLGRLVNNGSATWSAIGV
ncbi:MAG: hypothetical protein HZB35_00585, partial [Nitrospirae bacterium]|nr:hypothetical protein [Nitrospirota bacterium]